MKITKILCLIMSIIMCFGILSFQIFAENRIGFDNFIKPNDWQNNKFTDVNSNDWYYYSVKNVYELGIMTGKSENDFDADGEVTLAEAISIAARIHAKYYNIRDAFYTTHPWHATYFDYAMRNHFKILNENNMIIEIDWSIRKDIDYDQKISRACFAVMICSLFESSVFEKINHVPMGAISDVNIKSCYAPAVYELYSAGILNGSDSEGHFNPEKAIKRSELATIINRIIFPIQRIDKTI